MNRFSAATLATALLSLPALEAEEAKPVKTVEPNVEFRQTAPVPQPVARTLREAVDELPDADLEAIVGLLREHYLAPEKINEAALARATAQGLFERFAPGFSLLYEPAKEAAADQPFRSESIDQRAGYIRLGSLTEERLGEIDAALKIFTERALPAAIIDLRATPAGSNFELAAKICERFCPKGRVLFTVRRPHTQQELILTSKQDPAFSGIVVTLVDADTAGAAEAISAVLRTQAKALIIGQRTRGETVEYAEVALPSGRKMRVAVAEVALPENIVVFPGGIQPDVDVDISPEENEKVLKTGLESGVASLVVETERPRINEAALVAGTNPELDAYRASRGKKAETPLRDTVLQRALDAITTIALFEKKPAAKK
jgi:hypothetical protein